MISSTPSATDAAAKPLPDFMKAAQGKDYGDIDEMLSVQAGVRVPRIADLPPRKRSSHMIIQTLAVALAPGDCRVLSGKTREFQGPPSFPYIPAGDVCGIVAELPHPKDPNKESYFKLGDLVAARFAVVPRDALAEYAVISTSVCDKVPAGISPDDAAALAGATPSTIVGDYVRKGERVLILGAAGGEGSHVCQHVRRQGASLIVGVSEAPDRLLTDPMNCDEAVDYTKEDVFSMTKYLDEPFDVVIDLAAVGWQRLVQDHKKGQTKSIVKSANSGGRYLTTCPCDPVFEGHTIFTMLNLFLFTPLIRAIASRIFTRRTLPKYTYILALPGTRHIMTRYVKSILSTRVTLV
jgi:NADPH:quinone reductase-like Zn-dependent oxidoreductase